MRSELLKVLDELVDLTAWDDPDRRLDWCYLRGEVASGTGCVEEADILAALAWHDHHVRRLGARLPGLPRCDGEEDEPDCPALGSRVSTLNG